MTNWVDAEFFFGAVCGFLEELFSCYPLNLLFGALLFVVMTNWLLSLRRF